jgi:hypothetical protein
MTPTRLMTDFRALVLIAIPMLTLACGGGDGSDHDFPTCPANTFRLQGMIDGLSVDITEPGSGGGLTQGDGGEFQSQSSLTTPDPRATDLRLAWTRGITTGSTAGATGTLRMANGSFAGQAFCTGDGTRVHIPEDDALAIIQFDLGGLRTGSSCTEAHTGTLTGCMR